MWAFWIDEGCPLTLCLDIAERRRALFLCGGSTPGIEAQVHAQGHRLITLPRDGELPAALARCLDSLPDLEALVIAAPFPAPSWVLGKGRLDLALLGLQDSPLPGLELLLDPARPGDELTHTLSTFLQHRPGFRAACQADAMQLYHWQSQPGVRRYFREPAVPDYEEHCRWLATVLADPSRHLWLLTLAGRPVGALRLDQTGPEQAELSILLGEEARGQGIASAALALIRRCYPEWRLLAEVHPDNGPSRRLFHRAGFCPAGNHLVSAPLITGGNYGF